MYNIINPYLFLLFSCFVFLFSYSLSYSSHHEAHSAINNVSYNFIANFPQHYGDKRQIIVHDDWKSANALIFSWYNV